MCCLFYSFFSSLCLTNDNDNIHNNAIYITVTGGSGSNYQFTWRDELDNIVSDAEDPSGLGHGNYTVTVTDEAGCSAINDFIITDIDEIKHGTELEKLISLVPNPTSGKVQLNLNLNNYCEVKIGVYDNQGKAIFIIPSKQINIESFHFDFSEYTTGIYYFKISADETIVTKKLVYRK